MTSVNGIGIIMIDFHIFTVLSMVQPYSTAESYRFKENVIIFALFAYQNDEFIKKSTQMSYPGTDLTKQDNSIESTDFRLRR